MSRVFKFGGASVKDADSVRNMTGIIRKEYGQGERLVIVVSAMGKTTNALENILFKCLSGNDFKADIIALYDFHKQIIENLNFDNPQKVIALLKTEIEELEQTLSEISTNNNIAESEKYDRVIPFGEIISTRIIKEYLDFTGVRIEWLDAREYIKTSDDFREGIILWDESTEKIQNLVENKIYLTQGFIGSTCDGRNATLGREGSDFTAAIFGNCLSAKSVTIWKDVPGILNADPKLFDETRQFDKLSYSEASEMTYYGASVIHPKTIKPLANKEIPLLVKSFLFPEKPGTEIGKESSEKSLPVIILKANQALISFKVKDFTFINEEQIGLIFNALDKFLVKINVMQNSAISLTIAVDNRKDKIDKLTSELKGSFDIKYRENLSLYTIINYEDESISKVLHNQSVILEQRTLKTCQYIVSGTGL